MNNSLLCHILVVDDEPDLEELMRQRMRREIRRGAYHLEFASNGRHALEKLREHPEIDIVLSDINMPVMDGLTLLDNIPLINAQVKAVMISAYGDMKNIRSAMNRGAFDFITKPVDFEDLRTTITRTTQAVEAARQNLANRDKLLSIQTELATASKMQKSILQSTFPESESYHVYANMEAARQVGGDFYDVRAIRSGSDDYLGVCVADVSGKGVPAALFMMASWTLLRGATIGHREPGKVVQEVNNMLEQQNDSMMFVTLFYGLFNPRDRLFRYANAGHNSPIVFRADGSVEDLATSNGIALGIVQSEQFNENTIKLNKGDVVVMYTDGVNEAETEDEELFGMDRLKDVFGGNPPPLDAKKVIDVVFASVRDYVGDYPQSDDITCVAFCVAE